MSHRPQSMAIELDHLFEELCVKPIAFSECLIAKGWSLTFTAGANASLHYVSRGTGRIIVAGRPPVKFGPGALLVTPPGHGYRIESARGQGLASARRTLQITLPPVADRFDRWAAGDAEPEVVIICGHFVARDNTLRDLFAGLNGPAVQPFADNTPGALIGLIRDELVSQRSGMQTMAAALLRQLLVMLFRQAIATHEGWVESLTVLRDGKVMRAFHAMVSRPGDPHSLQSLADIACLSRSAFVKRFSDAFGQPPMFVLRELRLLRAAQLLRGQALSIQQISNAVGYGSASSFSRAFHARFGCEPSVYPAVAISAAADHDLPGCSS